MGMETREWDRTEFEALLSDAKEKGYKKKEIAELLGISPPTLSDWVSGKHVPQPHLQGRFGEVRKKLKDRRAGGKPVRKKKPES